MEVTAVLAVLIILVGGIAVWRLTSGPLDIGFAKEYVQSALKDTEQGYNISFDRIVLQWPDLKGPLLISAQNVNVLGKNETLASMEEVAISLAKGPLLIGKIYPKAIILQKPKIKIVRDKQGTFNLDFEDKKNVASNHSAENQTKVIKEMLDLLLLPPHHAREKKSPLSRLQSFEIAKALLIVEDHKMGMSWLLPEVSAEFSRTEKGIQAVVDASLKRSGEYAGVSGKIIYDRYAQGFLIDTAIERLDPALFSRNFESLSFLKDQHLTINGHISASVNKEMELEKAFLSLDSDSGAIFVPGVYNEAVPFKDLSLKLSYEKEWNLAELSSFGITLRDLPIKMRSKIKLAEGVVEGPVNIEIADLPLRKIGPLWPDMLEGEPAQEWLTKKLSGGRFYDAAISFDLKAQEDEIKGWQLDVKNIESLFSFDRLKIDYRAPLFAVTQAKGSGSLKEGAIDIHVTGGMVSDMALSEGRIVLDDLFVKGAGTAAIDLALKGPLQTILRYIQQEPFSLGKNLDFNVEDVRGEADLKASVDFPTVKDLDEEDLEIVIEAVVRDVRIPNVVRKLDLTEGPLSVKVAKGKVDIGGKAKIGGHDIDFSWERYINESAAPYISKLKASLITDDTFRDRFGVNLEDFLLGPVPVDLVYTETSKTAADIDVNADITTARFFVDPFDYEKPIGQSGRVTARVHLSNDQVQEIENLYLKTKDAFAEKGHFIFGKVGGQHDLKRGSIPKVMLGENSFALDFEVPRKNALKVSIDGSFLDAVPFLEGGDNDKPYTGPALIASAKAQRMRTAKTRMVENAKVYVDLSNRGDINQLEVDAKAGKGAIYLRYKPDVDKKLKFRLEADDAGAFLRAFDVYDNVQGGAITVYGEPVRGGHKNDLSGIVRIEKFKVTKAPALARLLSVMSLTGIGDLLNNQGLGFSKLEAKFQYLKKRHGTLIQFENGRTSGSSVGVTFSGEIDKGRDEINMQGTVAPMSEINSLLREIPLVGQILTGGEGIIAAKYTMKGKASDPDVSINPLSVLTPGFLRDILFQDE